MRREHENVHAALAAHGVFSRRTGIARRRAKDIELFALVFQHVFKEIAEQLHGHVFEGQRRAVGQLEQPQTGLQPAQRRNLPRIVARTGIAIHLGGIGLVRQRFQIIGRNVVDELRQNGKSQIGVGQLPPQIQLGARNQRIGLWQIKTAIGS